jgi:hypothetical protein
VLHLQVAKTRTRFLRFSWDEGAILTVPAAGLSVDTATRIPKPRAGGELLGIIQEALVLPDRYRLESTKARVALRPFMGTIAHPGLPPGSYNLIPEYAGGIRGEVHPLRIEHGRLTIVALEPEAVGALEAAAGPTACSEAERLTVAQQTQGATGIVERTVARAELTGDCTVRISGLAPGRYRATFDRAQPGFAASAEVEVAAQEQAHVLVDPELVRVFGTVLVNKKPALDMTLRFTPVNRPGPSVAEARLGPGGIFAVTLAGPGEYRVVPRRGSHSLLGSDRTAIFEPGPNEFNWSIDGGSVAFELVNWDKSSPVTVQLRRLQHELELNRNTQSEFRVDVSDRHPVVLDGIGFGSYEVQARQRRPDGEVLVSKVRQFKVDEASPPQEIDLTLERYEGRLLLRTSSGVPVRGATAWINTVIQLDETEPGVFVFSGEQVIPGATIQIFAPGSAPTCRQAPVDGAELVVVVDPGLPTLVKFTHPRATKPTDVPWPPGELIVPEAGCSVSLRRVEHVASGYEPEHTFLFFFPHFPRHPAPVFRWGGLLVTGVRGADGVLRVIVPKS